MTKQLAQVDPADIEHIDFDCTKLCIIPAESEDAEEMGWQLVESGGGDGPDHRPPAPRAQH